MFRACELKDQTYKKTRTLHFSGKRFKWRRSWGLRAGVRMPLESDKVPLFRKRARDFMPYNPSFYCIVLGVFLLISGVAPANQTKERSVHELSAGAFRNKSSM